MAKVELSAKHIISEALRTGTPLQYALNWAFEITDEEGRRVALLSFEEAADIDLQIIGRSSSKSSWDRTSYVVRHKYIPHNTNPHTTD